MMTPPPAFAEMRHHGLATEEHAFDIHRIDLVELVFVDLEHRLVDVRGAGIVDQNVERPESRERSLDGGGKVGSSWSTSQRSAMALLPIARATFLAASASISTTATRAPSRAYVSAMHLPMPEPAPVTRAVLPSRRIPHLPALFSRLLISRFSVCFRHDPVRLSPSRSPSSVRVFGLYSQPIQPL